MLIKFFPNGKGAGAGPVGYLVAREVLAYDENRDLIRCDDGQPKNVIRTPLDRSAILEDRMCRSCFETFIRFGGSKAFIVKLGNQPVLAAKQQSPILEGQVELWVESVWSQSFGATAQAILKSEPFEFSAAGLASLDTDTLRAGAVTAVQEAIERERIDLYSPDGEQRALAVLFGFLNEAQQAAMQIEFYVWTTQRDDRVRQGHSERHDQVFRWDDPPAGGHPSEDFGCRCYARALGLEGYWERIAPSADAFTYDLAAWEGNVDHMYLDTRGFVTVGKGKMLPDANSAIELPFHQRSTGALASAEEIRSEYDRIAGMEASQSRDAAFYEPFTSLYLPQADIDRLVQEHMHGDFAALVKQYPEFGNLPLSAQIALWDMIYNLGPAGLAEFRMLRQAIRDGNWEEAAAQSHRIGPGEERNQYVYDLFMDAATEP